VALSGSYQLAAIENRNSDRKANGSWQHRAGNESYVAYAAKVAGLWQRNIAAAG
jgi:hypothetical protein